MFLTWPFCLSSTILLTFVVISICDPEYAEFDRVRRAKTVKAKWKAMTLQQKCLQVKNRLKTECTKYTAVCCSDNPGKALNLCTMHLDGSNVKVYNNKCELQKARCRDLDTCIIQMKNTRVCEKVLPERWSTCAMLPTPPVKPPVIAATGQLGIGKATPGMNCQCSCSSSPPALPKIFERL
ncbi:uncharacterized protein [Amphiura filiformis]|uniref:uncharacterized protein n=1 Tax=Amphiura filiformis TaxID=82378 RepID=UPI003B21C8C8